MKEEISSILTPSDYSTNPTRLQTHIFTDKVVYRPNDVIFIEVLVLDAFNKTPIALDPKDRYNYNYYLNLEMKDSAGSSIYSSSNYVQNTTATFTYKVPQDASGGEYTISASNYYSVTPAVKLIRIRDYPRDAINIQVDLPVESYRPGDTVSGKIKLELPDGSAFESVPTYSFTASFETSTAINGSSVKSVNKNNLQTSLQGEGLFSFVIPNDTTQTLTSIAFTVTYEETVQTYSKPLVITQTDQMIIDFYTETYSTLVENVTNKVYFQAWATNKRADVYEFTNASLIAEDENRTKTILVSNLIKTEHRGKGSFTFKHSAKFVKLYLTFTSQ